MGEGEKGGVKRKKKERNIYVWIWIYMDSKEQKIIPKEKGGIEGRKRGKHFFFTLPPVIAGPGRHLYSTRRKC